MSSDITFVLRIDARAVHRREESRLHLRLGRLHCDVVQLSICMRIIIPRQYERLSWACCCRRCSLSPLPTAFGFCGSYLLRSSADFEGRAKHTLSNSIFLFCSSLEKFKHQFTTISLSRSEEAAGPKVSRQYGKASGDSWRFLCRPVGE